MLAPVFETSGRVARFADWMVKDTSGPLGQGRARGAVGGDREARGCAR